MKPNLLLPLFAVLFTAGVSFGINALAATFAEPASAPPADNAYAPLDTGPNTNNKNGILGVTGFTSHSTTFLALDSGNVGIGTADPQSKLDVAGTVTATGFKLSTAGAGAGKVLTSGADGDATWEATPSQIVTQANLGAVLNGHQSISFTPFSNSMSITATMSCTSTGCSATLSNGAVCRNANSSWSVSCIAEQVGNSLNVLTLVPTTLGVIVGEHRSNSLQDLVQSGNGTDNPTYLIPWE